MTGNSWLNATWRALAVLAVLLILPFSAHAQEDDMQTTIRPGLSYSIQLTAENMFMEPRVNGAPLFLHGRFDPVLATVDITAMVQPGANDIQIDYEPFNTETQSYTPHEGVKVQVRLLRSSNPLIQPQVDEQVILFSGRFDPEEGRLVASDTSVFNEGPVLRQDGGLVVSGDYQLEPVTILYDGAASEDQAMRLTLPFRIDDIAMTTPPWLGAPALSDTPALRRDLLAAYRQVHAALASANPDRVAAVAEPMFTHLGRVTGYDSATDFARAVHAARPFGGTDGLTLAPPPSEVSARTGGLLFAANGRLVRFAEPFLALRDSTGAVATSYNYWFCRVDAALAPCYAQDIPY